MAKIKKSNEVLFRVIIFAVTAAFLILIWSKRGDLAHLSKLGYLGIFLINFISSATVLFPLPGVAAVFLGGAIWNPFWVGLSSGIGASLGELTGYLLGYGGRGLLKSWEKQKWVETVEHFFHRTGFMTTFIFSALPLPLFDIIGIIAGILNYPIWKFALATVLGRVLRNILIAWSGAKILPY